MPSVTSPSGAGIGAPSALVQSVGWSSGCDQVSATRAPRGPCRGAAARADEHPAARAASASSSPRRVLPACARRAAPREVRRGERARRRRRALLDVGRAGRAALLGPLHGLLEHAAALGRGGEQERHAGVVGREARERLVLARGLGEPAVRAEQIAEAPPRHRIVRRELDDLAEGAPRLGLVSSPSAAASAARGEAQVELADGGAQARVGVGAARSLRPSSRAPASSPASSSASSSSSASGNRRATAAAARAACCTRSAGVFASFERSWRGCPGRSSSARARRAARASPAGSSRARACRGRARRRRRGP